VACLSRPLLSYAPELLPSGLPFAPAPQKLARAPPKWLAFLAHSSAMLQSSSQVACLSRPLLSYAPELLPSGLPFAPAPQLCSRAHPKWLASLARSSETRQSPSQVACLSRPLLGNASEPIRSGFSFSPAPQQRPRAPPMHLVPPALSSPCSSSAPKRLKVTLAFAQVAPPVGARPVPPLDGPLFLARWVRASPGGTVLLGRRLLFVCSALLLFLLNAPLLLSTASGGSQNSQNSPTRRKEAGAGSSIRVKRAYFDTAPSTSSAVCLLVG